jgi:hypothetical protein
MLISTVGADETYLLEHRNEPLPIIVDDLLNDLGDWQLYEDAENELQLREDSRAPLQARQPAVRLRRANLECRAGGLRLTLRLTPGQP